MLASQGIQQEVERKPRAVPGLRFRKPQRRLFVGREIDAGRNDIDALAFDFHAVSRQQDQHRSMARQQINHHAIVARVEVLHDNEGHAVGRRKRVQKLPAGVKAASRSADCDDRKIRSRAGGERPLKPMRSIRLDMMRTTSKHSAIFLEGRGSTGAAMDQYQNSGSIANYFEEDSFAPTRIANPAMSTFRIFPDRDASIIVGSASPRPNGSRG